MKKMKNYFLVMMVTLMMIIPALSGTSTVKAQVELEDVMDYANDAVSLFERIFCPDGPKLRCKGGECSQGACISFRSICYDAGKKC